MTFCHVWWLTAMISGLLPCLLTYCHDWWLTALMTYCHIDWWLTARIDNCHGWWLTAISASSYLLIMRRYLDVSTRLVSSTSTKVKGVAHVDIQSTPPQTQVFDSPDYIIPAQVFFCDWYHFFYSRKTRLGFICLLWFKQSVMNEEEKKNFMGYVAPWDALNKSF